MFKHRIIEGPGDSHAAVIELAGSFESKSAREAHDLESATDLTPKIAFPE